MRITKICSRLIIGPQICPHSYFQSLWKVPLLQKGLCRCDLIKRFEMRGLSWIMQVDHSIHQGLYKRDEKGAGVRDEDLWAEIIIRMMCFGDGGSNKSHEMQTATRSCKRQVNRSSSQAFREEPALSYLHLSPIDIGLLSPKTVR